MSEQLSLFDVEVWRPVVGYEDTYVVSNHGRVMRTKDGLNKSNPSLAGTFLKPVLGNTGYFQHALHRNGKQKTYQTHKLVMLAFVGRCPSGKEINHKDGVKTNNNLDNLEYVTHTENMRHMDRLGLREAAYGENHHRALLTKVQVDEIRRMYATGNYNQPQLAELFGVKRNTIGSIIQGKSWRK